MHRIPFARIGWLVDRMHVGTPDADVAAEIRQRCAVNSGDHWTAAEIDAAICHALRRHAVNRGRYARVTAAYAMGGFSR